MGSISAPRRKPTRVGAVRRTTPSVLLALLVYGYANGVFSSQKIERATYDSVAFRFIAAGPHPDHDTLATFRRRFFDELACLFVQVLEMAREMRLLKLGTISLDGSMLVVALGVTQECQRLRSAQY
jgi:transposase